MGRRKMGDTRRRQILEGLLNAIAERGLQNINMTDVAGAAGVSRGILHYYFKNKDEMISALVAYLKDNNLLQYQVETTQPDDAWDQLTASLWYPVNTFGKAGMRLARVWIEFWALSPHHAAVHEFVLEAQAILRDHFQKIVQDGVASGAFGSGIDPGRVATLILAALEGIMVQWMGNPDGFSFPGALKSLQEMLEKYLRG